MKATLDKTSFTPLTLTITIESEEEARALYAIFNHRRNVSLLPKNIACRKMLSKYTTPSEEVIANGVTYEQFYQ